ncbi:MAG TPA: glycogen debranching protein GlgX [Gemmatimonadaceae bacterium]|jgi:glycogen debranching enzyme GlgX/4-alpha-glucanotransferase
MPRVQAGLPEPLGLTLTADGANVAVFSAHAERIELCLFDAHGRETRIALPSRTGDVFHGFVEGIAAGQRWGLRAHGPYAPHEGHRFNTAKLLIDPYARAFDRAFAFHPAMLGEREDGARNDEDSAAVVPKCVAVAPMEPVAPHRTRVPWGETIIYEMHVRGYTKRHPEVPPALRGTCAALAHPAAIAHLVELGVTTVELMPLAAAVDEPHLARNGLTNYWGYNTIGWFAPDPRLAPGGMTELRDAVAALHDAGLEVILDVVLNHSGEGDASGPTLSLRGLDNATYYRTHVGAAHRYVDDTGCGNTLALDRPPVMRLALDTLRHWAQAIGADGFRFDLATTLGRRDAGFDANAPLLAAINADPLLRGLKLIAEPWDVGPGGYQAGAFGTEWAEWNDKYRDTVRRWWRGDEGLTGELATRLAGSADLFHRRQRTPSRSVNFVASHDGFTLADLVSYGEKHNETNGEKNRDGTAANHSWNHGVEGATDDVRVQSARRRDVRALLATLFCSRGTPMLAMGDEFGRTQHGNNNAYAQDNEVTWLDWDGADHALARFVASLTELRRAHPALRADRWLTGITNPATSLADVTWHRADGGEMNTADWEAPDQRILVAVLAEGSSFTTADRVAVVLNGTDRDQPVMLPRARRGSSWHLVLDTASDAPVRDWALPTPAGIAVPARAVALVVERSETASYSVEGATPSRPPVPTDDAPRATMTFPRSAGILLHPTSLPGPHGIGDLGPAAHRFVDVLADAGMTLWQVLPLGPTGYGDSPYQCFSAFAGNPLLVHVAGEGGDFPAHSVDFGRVIAHKQALLRAATAAMTPDDGYRAFCAEQAWWLEDYALFMALKHAHGGSAWTSWETGAASRDSHALATWRTKLSDDIEHVRREQYLFFTQFRTLRQACHRRGIRLMGDLPIYVAHDSADVWANPSLFKLDAQGRPAVQAGVPPDYFCATGQLWGNPIYDWETLRATGYDWWVRRMRAAFAMFDTVRIDHFRGFEAYWEVPGTDTTAVNGEWVPGPGAALFEAITRALGPLPIVAENLGVITPAVEALREQFGYPGMSILQFAFGGDDQANNFQPHTYPRERVVYTGTHDNDTTVGWWNSKPGGDSIRTAADIEREKDFARRYLGTDGHEIHWTLIRAVLASVADTVLIPLQDVLGLGSEARMNLPGRQAGNWGFRFTWEQLTPDLVQRLRALVDLYDR